MATGALLLFDGVWPIGTGQSRALLRGKIVLGAAVILAGVLGLVGQ
jgi:hypothetical protein